MALKKKISSKSTGSRGSRARLPMIKDRMRPEELEFCAKLGACNWNIREAARQMEWRERKGYVVANRPRVTAFITKMGGHVEKEIAKAVAKKVAEKLILDVEAVDSGLAAVIKACQNNSNLPEYGLTLVKAAELAYKRMGIIQSGTTNILANQVNSPQVQVYQSKWLKPVEPEKQLPPPTIDAQEVSK